MVRKGGRLPIMKALRKVVWMESAMACMDWILKYVEEGKSFLLWFHLLLGQLSCDCSACVPGVANETDKKNKTTIVLRCVTIPPHALLYSTLTVEVTPAYAQIPLWKDPLYCLLSREILMGNGILWCPLLAHFLQA